MKYKHVLAVFLVGFIMQLFGSFGRIMHTAWANKSLTIGFGLMILAAIMLVVKILTVKNKNHFLNK
ncbi:MAG: hypothetical protein ABJA78_14295 [Ferruginibacter sp.]